MDASGLSPWSFEIEFDEEEAARNGYDPDELYDCVGRIVEPMGNVRTARGSWQAESRENQFGAQCPAVALLVLSLIHISPPRPRIAATSATRTGRTWPCLGNSPKRTVSSRS